MPLFRKRPVVIEARRVDTIGDKLLSAWCGGEWVSNGIKITTLEGDMLASPGDWIISGVSGEFYPCKHDIFLKTYEPA